MKIERKSKMREFKIFRSKKNKSLWDKENCDTKNEKDNLCTKTKNTSLEKERDY